MQLKGKKVIAIGERDGIQGRSISDCAKAAGAEVVLQITHCFVWTAAGALDLDGQEEILQVVEEHDRDDLVVLLGTPNADSSQLFGLTVTQGDPSWAGALAGNALGLPVYHVTEPEIKEQIPADVYEQQLAVSEMVLETDEIIAAMRQVREEQG